MQRKQCTESIGMFGFGKPSKDQFAKSFLAVVNQSVQDAQYEYDAENFRLVEKDSNGLINLSNMYAEHCSLPRNVRKEHLRTLASVFTETADELPEDYEEARSHLRPKIWNRSSYAMMELSHQINGEKRLEVPLYPVGSHLYSSLVFDTENAMQTVSEENLEKWGVSYYEAMEAACQNLDDSTMAFACIGEHFHSSVSGDSYDSSRVLLLDRIRQFDVIGEPIAIVPQRDAMYVAGSTDETSLRIMFDLTHKAVTEEPRPLSPLPLKLEDGEWVDWVPPRNHAIREQYDDLELRFLGGLYSEQKELLDVLLEKQGHDIFVANFSALEEEDGGKLLSYCVWGRNVDYLLPRTQYVVFVDDSGTRAAGEWDHVLDVIGDLLIPDELYYPVRYRANEFPSDNQLSEIGLHEAFTNES